MAPDGFGSFRGRQQPLSGSRGVGDRLLGRKRLGGYDEERRLRIALSQRLGDVSAVDVGDKMDAHVSLAVRLERLRHHDRAEIGAADADVHDVFDGLAAVAGPLPGPDLPAERAHLLEDPMHILADGPEPMVVLGRSQRDMQNGTILGGVDLLAREHGLAALPQVGLLGKLEQEVERLLGDAVLGEIEEDVLELHRKILKSLRLFLEPLTHVLAFDLLIMGLELGVDRQLGEEHTSFPGYGERHSTVQCLKRKRQRPPFAAVRGGR